MLWVKNKAIPQQWRNYTKSSRYYDQASIEDLYEFYKKKDMVFTFDDNYNLQSWRFIVGEENGETIASYMKPDVKSNRIFYKNKPLKFIHTHFNKPEFEKLNLFFIQKMMEAKMYKELLCVYRCKYNKWIISVPKQPMTVWEVITMIVFVNYLYVKCYQDIDVVFHDDSIHCKYYLILYCMIDNIELGKR